MPAAKAPPVTTPRISVIQPGARLHYAMPAIFAQAGWLTRLYTDLHADHAWLRGVEGLLPDRAKTRPLRRLFGRTLPADLPASLVHDRAGETLLRTLAARAGMAGHGPDRMSRRLLADLEGAGLGAGDTVYTALINEDLETMRRLKDRGVRIVHECIVAPTISLFLAEEHRRWPGLVPQTDKDEAAIGMERDALKYEVADRVLVPSPFVHGQVAPMVSATDKLATVAYGLDTKRFSGPSETEPGRILSVGKPGLVKGTPHLADAARRLATRAPRITVRVVGPTHGIDLDHPAMRGPAYIGQVPRAQVVEEFRRADVLAFPTICDSFGLVLVEAMAMGVPVVATDHCGDVVRDGIDGFVVPARDPEALADRLQQIVEDRALRARMSDNARARAQDFSMQAYADRLLGAVGQVA